MAAEDPSFYTLQADLSGEGLNQGDTHKAIYNLYLAVVTICHNLDDDSGTSGTDYESYIGTPLATAFSKLKTPVGATGT